MADLFTALQHAIDASGGLDNYIDINIAQAPDVFTDYEVEAARKRLFENGIGATTIDKKRIMAYKVIKVNHHYYDFTNEQLIYAIRCAWSKTNEELSAELEKPVASVAKLMRKIKDLMI